MSAPGAARRRLDLALLNPSGFPEVAARRLRPWLAALAAELAPDADSLGVRFCGDRTMRRVNRTYRGRDATTDVLSFPGDSAPTPEGRHLGDILVSVPTARRQAAAAGETLEQELRRLLLHGVLHCLGYDHETDDGTMERLERRLHRTWLAAAPAAAGGGGDG